MIEINNGKAPPNIVMSANVQRDLSAGERLVLPPVMAFIMDAALIYPRWKFVATRTHSTSIPHETKFCMVYKLDVLDERDDVLGKIELCGWSYNTDSVDFTNSRIQRAAQRGNSKRTTKQDVALKILKKWFTAPPLSEVMEIAHDKIKHEYLSRMSNIGHTYRNSISAVMTALESYVMDNIDELWQKMDSKRMPAFTLEQLKTAKQDVEIASSVDTRNFLTVVIRDGKYIIQRENKLPQVVMSDGLSEHMRRSLGLLKLVEPSQFVGGAGFKGKDDVYFVIDDQPKT